MEKILELLTKYSANGKMVDKDFIEETVSILTRLKDLKTFIEGVEYNYDGEYINCSNEEAVAGYSLFNKKVYVNDELIPNVYHSTLEELDQYECSDFARSIAANGMILSILLHEVEHASQYKRSRGVNDSFENRLLAICFHTDFEKLRLNKNNKEASEAFINDRIVDNELKASFSDISPYERLAWIDSMIELIELLLPLEVEVSEIIDSFQGMLDHHYMNGYTGTMGPTIKYLRKYRNLLINGTDEFFDEHYHKLFNAANNDDIEKRVRLGLSLTRKEHKFLSQNYE